MKNTINIFWFKRDLRLYDNDALNAILLKGKPVLLVYILEPSLVADKHYSNRHWQFIAESISNLNEQLKIHNTSIVVLKGTVISIFKQILKTYTVNAVYSTEETGLQLTYVRDKAFKKFCQEQTINWQEFRNGGVVRGLKNRNTWRESWYTYMGTTIAHPNLKGATFLKIDTTNLTPYLIAKVPHTNTTLSLQKGGRTAGLEWAASFFEERIKFYATHISKPELARYGCSRLSPYFAWGCLSVREIYQQGVQLKTTSAHKKSLSAFMSRLRWQAHFVQKFEMEPRIEFEAFNKGYLQMKQPLNEEHVTLWKSGKTGYPLVDASLRAVKETGYLNFRMRAMCVSFLTHHLFQHFSTGAAWLAQQFLDFEPGIHYAQFQMQAGLTATNTIRIYNPTKNAQEHDAAAVFIKKWIPELRGLPNNLAIEPWETTAMEQMMYNTVLGVDYPHRMVDISVTRKHALTQIFNIRKQTTTIREKKRILNVHTLKRRFP